MIINESSSNKAIIVTKNDFSSIAEDVLIKEIPKYINTFQLLRGSDDNVFELNTTIPLNSEIKLMIESIGVVKYIKWN